MNRITQYFASDDLDKADDRQELVSGLAELYKSLQSKLKSHPIDAKRVVADALKSDFDNIVFE